MKNRVGPGKPADLSSDTFFGTTEKRKNKPDLNAKSRNIDKAKNKFTNNKNDKFFTKSNKSKQRLTTRKTQDFKQKERFRNVDEDADYVAQNKNKCREIIKYKEPRGEKKFDKKTWRLKNYSKKYKLEQWEEKRKKAVLKEYYQKTKDENPKIDVKKIYEQYDSDNEIIENENNQNETDSGQNQETPKNYVRNPNFKPKISTKKKVKMELERIKAEKLQKREEILKKKEEKDEALKLYKQKKQQKEKKLNQKTKRGQPIMKGRMEMLLEKIQNG